MEKVIYEVRVSHSLFFVFFIQFFPNIDSFVFLDPFFVLLRLTVDLALFGLAVDLVRLWID